MAINLNELTNGSINKSEPTKPYWQGTAIFDVLMKSVNDNINIQYETNRITGADYAKVYLAGIETCIKESINFLLQKAAIEKDLELKAQQILSMRNDDSIKSAQSTKDLEIKTAQKNKLIDDMLTAAKQRDLYQRQIEGFDDNKLQKLFESQISSWGLMFSSGMLEEKPAFITGTQVTDLYNKLIKDN